MATWYKINASAKLTVRADSLNVRSGPQLYDFVKSVKAGEVVQATERALISGDPWFHISDGWISGKYVEGWVKDNNNNNSWWYVEKKLRISVCHLENHWREGLLLWKRRLSVCLLLY